MDGGNKEEKDRKEEVGCAYRGGGRFHKRRGLEGVVYGNLGLQNAVTSLKRQSLSST